jgi:hypothetical protein
MSITATNTGAGGGVLAPAGNHVARCYAMIDLGTSPDDYQGQPRIVHKVQVKWELPNATHVFKEGESAKPFSVSKEYNLSMNEKANLRLDLQSWRGKPFTEEEAKSFDITKVLGAACMLNVIVKTSKSGKEYNEVTSITPIPKDPQGKPLFEVPPQVNPTFEFSFEQFDQAKLASLPDWIQNKIKGSFEYKKLMSPDTAHAATEPEILGPKSDDLPF